MAMKIVASILVAGIAACAYAFEDCSFTAKLDGAEQRYLLSAPKGASGPVDVLVSLHGHGSDRTQIREDRGECRAARDVAAARGMALVSPDYRGTRLNYDMLMSILPELKAGYDFVFIPVLHRLKTHQYWQRWGATEFYRDADCVYYQLPLHPAAATSA